MNEHLEQGHSEADATAPTRREAMEAVAKVAKYIAPATLVFSSKVSNALPASPT